MTSKSVKAMIMLLWTSSKLHCCRDTVGKERLALAALASAPQEQ